VIADCARQFELCEDAPHVSLDGFAREAQALGDSLVGASFGP